MIFGADAYGVATVLTVFFTGLALGSYIFGRIIDSHANRALFLYGLLEIGIGVYAALTPLIFANLPVFSFTLATLVISMAILLMPTILMGGTWPAAVKAAAQMSADRSPGWLYGFNTLGATVGVFLAGFLLIWLLGMNLTILLAALINLVIGVGAIYLNLKLPLKFQNERHKLSISNQQSAISAHQRILLAVFFLTGFGALALEVLWTRVLILAFGTSTFAFSLILGTFLFGMALGSLIASQFFKRPGKTAFYLAISLLLLGLTVVVSSAFLGQAPKLIASFLSAQDYSFTRVMIAAVSINLMIVILPAILMGLNFVLGLRLLKGEADEVGEISRAYAVNTIGGVAGALLSGFLLLPNIGLQKSILTVSISYFFASIVVCFWLFDAKKTRWVVMVFSAMVVLAGFMYPAWNKHVLTSGVAIYFRDYLSGGLNFEQAVSQGEILYYKEGLLSTIIVKKAPEGFLFLRGDGKADASTDQDLDDMHLIGHLPMILHKNPRKVLVIGMGSGITLGSVVAHEEAKEIEVVEIEEAMIEAAKYFSEYNHNVLNDKEVRVIKSDVRGYLKRTGGKYDVITSQPSNLWVKGNANLFTSDFFEIAKNSLSDDGLILQWVPFYGMTSGQFKTILASFNKVFPTMTVWTPVVSHDVLLIGSKRPQVYDFDLLDGRVRQDSVQRDLKSAGIEDGESMLAHYLFDESKLKAYLGGSPIHTDNKPIVEFSAPFSLYKETVVENLQDLKRLMSFDANHFSNLDEVKRAKVNELQEAVQVIFDAKIKATGGNLEEAAEEFEKALKILPKSQTKKELARLYLELAKSEFEVNNIPKTIAYFETSVENHPNAQVYLNLSILYLQQNRVGKATEAVSRAKELDSNNPRIAEVEKAINQKKLGN